MDPLSSPISLSLGEPAANMKPSADSATRPLPKLSLSAPSGSNRGIGAMPSPNEVEVDGLCQISTLPDSPPAKSNFSADVASTMPSCDKVTPPRPKLTSSAPLGSVRVMLLELGKGVDVLALSHTTTHPTSLPFTVCVRDAAATKRPLPERPTPPRPSSSLAIPSAWNSKTLPPLSTFVSSLYEAAASTRPSADRATPPYPKWSLLAPCGSESCLHIVLV
mmetsp:Transcript_23317/g.59067  ORF Transcript_23317/g.59067 Transcript_23317/m.59067 type:complete len:220 (-) Transcript_23317:428-1087(-)